MRTPWLIWIPRVIIIAFALFTTMVYVDSYDGTGTIWQKLIRFVSNYSIFFILSFILIVTWNRPLIAGILYIVFSIVLTWMFHEPRSWQAFVIFASPPIVVGVLFIVVHFLDIRDIRR